MDECRHLLDPRWCADCNGTAPARRATRNLGATRTRHLTGTTKQEIADTICSALGLPPVPLLNGSTEPRGFFESIYDAFSLETPARASKPELAMHLVCLAGTAWDDAADSTATASGGGGTVTATGMSALREAVDVLREAFAPAAAAR